MDSRKIVRPGMHKPKGFSYFKTLIAAAITFVMLVILVPLMTNHRAKVSSDKPEPDKNKVVAEIPRSDAPGDPTTNSWGPAQSRDELPADSSVLRSQTETPSQSPPEKAEKMPETQAPPPPPVASAPHGSRAAAPQAPEKNGAASPAGRTASAAPATPSGGKGQSSMALPVPASGASKPGLTAGGNSAQASATAQKPKEQKTTAVAPSGSEAGKNVKDATAVRKSVKEASAAAPVDSEVNKPKTPPGTSGSEVKPKSPPGTSGSEAKPKSPPGTSSSEVKPKTPPGTSSSEVKPKSPSETSPPAPAAKETKLSSVEAPKAEKPKSGVQYVIQVGAFQKMENAQAIQESFRKKGYSVQIRSHYDLNKGQLYLVQLEPTGDAAKADATMNRIRQEGATPIMLKVGAGQ
ncbi:MAG: SPOR domain-containing protein [Syntrophobacteraceae bacterium]